MPVTATSYLVGLAAVTVPIFVPPAVPVIVTSPVAKPVTAALKMTVKVIGEVEVGSGCAAAWLIVTEGPPELTTRVKLWTAFGRFPFEAVNVNA
jgi:hypothetical protein